MKLAKRMTIYFTCLGIFSALGIVFCYTTACKVLASFLFCKGYFLFLQGKKQLIVSLCMGISTTAWFTAISFLINYHSKKQSVQKQLEYFYEEIRHRCYERIIYKQNDYDNDYEEVFSIMSFLKKYIDIVLDYAQNLPAIVRWFKKRKQKRVKEKILKKYYPFCKKDLDIFQFVGHNKYALICSIYSDLFTYFELISGYQNDISEQKHIITKINEKISQLPCTPSDLIEKISKYKEIIAKDVTTWTKEDNDFLSDFNFTAYHDYMDVKSEKNKMQNYIHMYEHYVDVTNNKLRSRYPYNTKEHQGFVKKKDIQAKFFEVNRQSFLGEHVGDLIFPELFLVEDHQELYSIDDEAVRYNGAYIMKYNEDSERVNSQQSSI